MILTLEGVTLPSQYLVKELSIVYDGSCAEYQHFQFKPPPGFNPTPLELRTIKFATNNLHQLPLYDRSLLAYSTIDSILQSLEPQTIIVAGNSAFSYVTSKLPFSRVIDICQQYNFTYPKQLDPACCFKTHRPRYCSLSKGLYIKQFMQENFIEM